MAETLNSVTEIFDSDTTNSCSKMAIGDAFGSGMSEKEPGLTVGEVKTTTVGCRAEIDTSAPFESVKEAVTRFGGIGFWRPHYSKQLPESENLDIKEEETVDVEEQAAQLEKDIIAKEKETLDILKELETAKLFIEELKIKLQKQASELSASLESSSIDWSSTSSIKEQEQGEEEEHENLEGLILCPSSTPGLILMQLKQAKLNLNRTTSDLSDIRASVESFIKKIEKEKISLEKTRKRLSSNSSKISSLEGELNQTIEKLQSSKNSENKGCLESEDPDDISRKLQILSSGVEQFKKMGDDAKSELLKAMLEIENTKSRIKTTEIRLIAAKKTKEAAKAAEEIAFSDIKALQNPEKNITLSFEEYSSLTSKAQEAEELAKKRVMDAMIEVDEANISNMEILKKVEEATEEVRASKKVLEEALNRVEAANKEKLYVEGALRKWRSEHGRNKRRNSSKFKNNYYPSHNRKDSVLTDLNGLNMVDNESNPVLKPTLSIGQILSQKLLNQNMFETEMYDVKEKVSLGQMLGKENRDVGIPRKEDVDKVNLVKKRCDDRGNLGNKQLSVKRKKFVFGRFSLLSTKQGKKKNRTFIYRPCSGTDLL